MLFLLLATILPTLIIADDSTCNIGPTRDVGFNMADLVGDTYWIYHEKNDLEENVGCIRDTFGKLVNNASEMTTLSYCKKDQDFKVQRGVVKEWTGSSFNNQYYGDSVWDGNYFFIGFEKNKYVAVKACLKGNTTPYIWLGFPTKEPSEADVAAAKAKVKESEGEADAESLVKFPDCDKMPPPGENPPV